MACRRTGRNGGASPSRAAQSGAACLHTKGQARVLLQARYQRRGHQRAWGPDAARGAAAGHVVQQAQRALGNHLAGGAIARIAVAGDHRLERLAARGAAHEQQLVAPGLAFLQ